MVQTKLPANCRLASVRVPRLAGGMAPAGNSSSRPGVPRALIAGLALAAVLTGVWLAGIDLRALVERGLAVVRAAGPGWYFAAMALLPLPLAWFTVPAGEAFAAQLTLPGVIAAGLAAVAVQVSLTYWVARWWLRPPVERFVARRGHAVPRVTTANALGVALVVRLTPGPPMVLGSCVLALAETPFALYLAVSCAVAFPWVCAGVILGRGLLQGDFVLVASGAGLLAAVVLAARLWHRRRIRP